MTQFTILDYYKYSTLATAAYVRMGGKDLSGSNFAAQAGLIEQGGGRLPATLGTSMFNPADPTAARWEVLDYFGNDVPASQDPIAAQEESGFAATLFRQGSEKVLAIRGTEPDADRFIGYLLRPLARAEGLARSGTRALAR